MSASTSGFKPDAPGGWSWPEDLPKEGAESSTRQRNSQPEHKGTTAGEYASQGKQQRYWKARQCRICLDTVQPTFHQPSETLPGLFGGSPYVTYDSEDGSRLIRPCKCKGTSRYVHDTCLQEWRHADPSYGRRNFWQCPTCQFTYRLERMRWGRWVSSAACQLILTVGIFWATIFVLGFVADPIINLYLDPMYTISHGTAFEEIYVTEEPTWWEHFAKGFASLGLLGFVKVLFTLTPWWHSIRIFGGSGGGRQTGRDRLGALSTFVILIGVLTFIYAVWKGVRAWSKRVLEKASERVMDVQGNDMDEEDDIQPSQST